MNPRRNLQTRKNRRKRNERWQKNAIRRTGGDPRIAMPFRRIPHYFRDDRVNALVYAMAHARDMLAHAVIMIEGH